MRYIFFLTIFFLYILDNDALSNDPNFIKWLEEFKIEAKTKGISDKTINSSLINVKLIPRVIELDRKQPEFTLTLNQYLNRVVTKNKVNKGISKTRENWELLEEVSLRYKVQPRFIVALWGIETDYGRVTGGFPVIDSLVTLAYDGRRRTYFTKELINALMIIEKGHIDKENMMGSWAGAMGQPQFMPSSFLGYAQDFNNDGRKDIWQTKEDVFASAANYLAQLKWNPDETWGREVSLSDEFIIDSNLMSLKHEKDLLEWQNIGVRKLNGSNLPRRKISASLIEVSNKDKKRYFLVYKNFKRILRWNTSNYFAIAVGKLSDAISIN